MGGMDGTLDLDDWRRRVALLYLTGPTEGEAGVAAFRRGRDELFRDHPQSALDQGQRARFTGLAWFPYDPGARVMAELRPPEDDGQLAVDTGGEDGTVRYRRVGRLVTPFGDLTLLWTLGYGGGLFLPFRDATAGDETYGAGRYLTDTIKGTWGRGLVHEGGRVVLDFNYAYNPSCAYNARWACPLAPPENHLGAPVRAGELAYPDSRSRDSWRAHCSRAASPTALSMHRPKRWKSSTWVENQVPMLIVTTTPISRARPPVTSPVTAWPRLSASPRLARTRPTMPSTTANRPRNAPRGENSNSSTSTSATTPITRAATPMPLRRPAARG
jgi:uncharacterized protein (DUF1684 family)